MTITTYELAGVSYLDTYTSAVVVAFKPYNHARARDQS